MFNTSRPGRVIPVLMCVHFKNESNHQQEIGALSQGKQILDFVNTLSKIYPSANFFMTYSAAREQAEKIKQNRENGHSTFSGIGGSNQAAVIAAMFNQRKDYLHLIGDTGPSCWSTLWCASRGGYTTIVESPRLQLLPISTIQHNPRVGRCGVDDPTVSADLAALKATLDQQTNLTFFLLWTNQTCPMECAIGGGEASIYQSPAQKKSITEFFKPYCDEASANRYTVILNSLNQPSDQANILKTLVNTKLGLSF